MKIVNPKDHNIVKGYANAEARNYIKTLIQKHNEK